jgi:hypothetical protein
MEGWKEERNIRKEAMEENHVRKDGRTDITLPRNHFTMLPRPTRHVLTSPLQWLLTMYFPSEEAQIEHGKLVSLSTMPSSWPVAVVHIIRVPSHEAL